MDIGKEKKTGEQRPDVVVVPPVRVPTETPSREPVRVPATPERKLVPA